LNLLKNDAQKIGISAHLAGIGRRSLESGKDCDSMATKARLGRDADMTGKQSRRAVPD
jgi:hypothetical protein